MKLRAISRRDAPAFEGDLALALRGLPADAQVLAARASVRPVQGPNQTRLFEEPVSLPNTVGDYGVTKGRAPDDSWVVADFHARRTVIRAGVSGATQVGVQVDIGGLWVPIHTDGSMAAPPDPNKLNFSVTNNAITLPNVVTPRLKLTRVDAAESVNLTSVTWLSFPTNVSLRIGEQGPFWFQIGELRAEVTTPGFTEPLRAYLRGAQVENGHTIVPFTLHSDAIARLEVALEIEYLRQQALLPSGVKEVVLPFTFEPLPQADPSLLKVALPPAARAVPGTTTARAAGTFEPSRIVLGPTTPVSPQAVVSVSPASSQAQPIRVPTDLAATAVDLLLEPLTPTAALSVTLLADADGKPWGESLLPRPVTIRLDQEVGAGLGWVSAPLPVEFQFKARGPDGRPRRYWLVVNSAEGEVNWAVRPQTEDAVGLHRSQDNGLSWQATEVPRTPGPVAGLFRLRHTPAQFQVPIELQVGKDDPAKQVKAQRVPLDRFQPLGRVDFALGFPEVAEAFDQYLTEAAPTPCPEGEHLANGDFERWVAVNPQKEIFLPEDWELTSGQVQRLYTNKPEISGTRTQPGALSQVVPVAGGCPYQFEFLAVANAEGAVADVIWLGEDCGAVRVDQVSLFIDPTRLHRARLRAPTEAAQAEVRFIVPAGNAAIIDRVSLAATAEMVANGDLREVQEGRRANWTVTPGEAVPGQVLKIHPVKTGVRIENAIDRAAALVQQIAVSAGQPYTLDFQGRVVKQPEEAITQVELRWLKADGSPAAADTVQPIAPTGFDRYFVEGAVPAEAAQVEVRLVVPAGATLEVSRISLRLVEPTTVPITFLAQAPGELAISEARVTYELVEPPPPAIPSTGLCTPTPPSQKPGVRPRDRCFCPCCATERSLRDIEPAVTPAGRPAVVGICRACGTRLVRQGGRLVTEAPVISSARPVIRRVPVTPPPRTPAIRPPAPAPAIQPSLTDIKGISEGRARRLAEIGIDSIERLAAAAPEDVARALRGVSVEMATGFIEEARQLLASR